jgi:hypothetical protein
MVVAPASGLGGPDCRDFLGHVDADRAPGDAPPAADTAGHVELIEPRGELVGQPLPVTPLDALAEVAAVDAGEFGVEAAVPAADALGILQTQIRDVFDAGAKAGRAHQRAVGAG